MLAGLQTLTAGTIRISGRIVNDPPPRDRDISRNICLMMNLKHQGFSMDRGELIERAFA
jgi:hypothetical protein